MQLSAASWFGRRMGDDKEDLFSGLVTALGLMADMIFQNVVFISKSLRMESWGGETGRGSGNGI